MIRCKHPEILQLDAAENRWPMRDLSYFQSIVYTGIDAGQVASEYAEAWRRIAAVCGVRPHPSASAEGSQIVASSGPIDGEYGILAETEIPDDDPAFVSHQLFDIAETELTSEQRIACMCHELCHALGVGHAPAGSPNLMAPVLSEISSPQAWDVAELQARYGAPDPSPATIDQHAPTSIEIDFTIQAPGDYTINLQAYPITGETADAITGGSVYTSLNLPGLQPGSYTITLQPSLSRK